MEYPSNGFATLVVDEAAKRQASYDVAVVRALADALFFASLVSEEGVRHPAALVLVPEAHCMAIAEWDITRFRDGRPLSPESIAKLASAAVPPHALLAVTPRDGSLVICGVAAPCVRGFQFEDPDSLLRMLSPKPGVLVATVGSVEIARYVAGVAMRSSNRFCPLRQGLVQWASVYQAAMPAVSELYPDDAGFLSRRLQRIIGRVSASQRGGLLAILSPLVEPDSVCEKAIWLQDPLPLGRLYDDSACLEFSADQAEVYRMDHRTGLDVSPMDADEAELARKARAASEAAERASEKVTQMLTIDGAVICTHALDVVAFGAKLRTDRKPVGGAFDVEEVNGRKKRGHDWTGKRGMRHWSAACFASRCEKGLAFVVSQDGDAAAVYDCGDGGVEKWSVKMPFYADSYLW